MNTEGPPDGATAERPGRSKLLPNRDGVHHKGVKSAKGSGQECPSHKMAGASPFAKATGPEAPAQQAGATRRVAPTSVMGRLMMAHPESSRFVPIRDAVCDVLRDTPALAELKAVVCDREAFAALGSSQYPALGVFFAETFGAERPRWVGNRRDHSYQLEVHVAVRSLESAQASEDLLLAYVEAVEDALREAPTLGGLVRAMAASLVRRWRSKVESYWHSQAVMLVIAEQRTG